MFDRHEVCVGGGGELVVNLHISNLRDSHEYELTQVWGERFLQGRVAGVWKEKG